MNRDVVCIYYSRTGNTEAVMREIAAELDCELAAVTDRVRRRGPLGRLRCGLDAMRVKTRAISRVETARPLGEYRLVILGAPVWAGRCASVMRAFLKRRGYELDSAAFVITHRSAETYRAVFDQMDLYLKKPHVADVSLRPGSVGCHFWLEQFARTCAAYVEGESAREAGDPAPEETDSQPEAEESDHVGQTAGN